MFAKVFTQIFDSSIAEDPNVRHLFMDLLVLADADGVVDMTPGAIAARTRIPKEDVLRWLDALERPDPESRSQAECGRRIVRLDEHRTWGWRLVNYRKYRESASKEMLRMMEADRKREYRRRNGRPSDSPTSPKPPTPLLQEAEGDPSMDSSGFVRDMSGTGKAIPPCSASPNKPNNGSLTASERISLEKESQELKRWLKSHQQDSYTASEAEIRRQKKARLVKIEAATHIPL